MNFLSLQNTFIKPHSSNSFLLETPPRNNYINDTRQSISENNNQIANGQEKSLQEVWSKHKFEMDKVKVESMVNFNNVKMTWAEEAPQQNFDEPVETKPEAVEEKKVKREEIEVHNNDKEESPSHHARRPPNAFLIFCKKHRPIVRERFPNLENRGVTKILGEWWALLNVTEKQPYNDLAKEYKDAFLSANPNFRWYKLPAPPLRTLTPRPTTTITKVQVPLSSPSNNHLFEFTPGKLADESQLGGLTSLMNNNFATTPKTECCTAGSNADSNNYGKDGLEKYNGSQMSPVNTIQPSTPPKPIKKRCLEFVSESKACSRNILPQKEDDGAIGQTDNSMTKQDIMNKVVDDIFAKHPDEEERNNSKEVRKSERMCKGKRYKIFMVEGRLLGNKRDTRLVQQWQCKMDTKIESELNTVNNNNKPETPKLDLGNTIKRLAERTNIKLDFDSPGAEVNESPPLPNQRTRSISETSEGNVKNSPPNFNLDLRISNLPCLSYDEFLQRKRESKKRKIRIKTDGEAKHKVQKLDKGETQLVGSKKRKNKQSITHLGKKDEEGLSNELLGLATLAEVAANTEKINEKISE